MPGIHDVALDPFAPRFVVGTEEDRQRARVAWHRERFVRQVTASDLAEIPSSRLRPLRGSLLEDSESGDFYVPRLDSTMDLDFVPSAVAYYVDGAGNPVLLERPTGVKNRGELKERQAARDQRRNAPKPRRQATRR